MITILLLRCATVIFTSVPEVLNLDLLGIVLYLLFDASLQGAVV